MEIEKIKEEEKKEKKLYNKNVYKSGIFLGLFLILFIISICFNSRIVLFSNIFSSSKYFVITIYYITIIVNIGYNAFMCIYTIIYKKLGKNWLDLTKKIDKFMDIPAFVCSCVAILFFIVTFIITPCNVSGSSMENTYKDKDKLMCSNLFYTPKRNDVIVFDSTNYTDSNGDLYIKRAIAVENDELYYNSDMYELYINGQLALTNLGVSQYLTITGQTDSFDYLNTYIIPKNKVLAIGDNRRISYDSRYFGLIDEKDIFGKVLFRIYPFKTAVMDTLD